MSQIPIGWFIEGFVSPEKQQVSMMIDGINQLSAPLFLPKGHYRNQNQQPILRISTGRVISRACFWSFDFRSTINQHYGFKMF